MRKRNKKRVLRKNLKLACQLIKLSKIKEEVKRKFKKLEKKLTKLIDNCLIKILGEAKYKYGYEDDIKESGLDDYFIEYFNMRHRKKEIKRDNVIYLKNYIKKEERKREVKA